MSRRNADLLRVALMIPHAGMGSGRSSFAYVQTISPAFFFGSHGPSFGTCRTRQDLGCACFRKDDAADSRPHSKVARQAGRCRGEHYCYSSVPPWREAQARQRGVAWPEARRNSPQRRFHECGTSQDCQGGRRQRHLPGEVVPNHGGGMGGARCKTGMAQPSDESRLFLLLLAPFGGICRGLAFGMGLGHPLNR